MIVSSFMFDGAGPEGEQVECPLWCPRTELCPWVSCSDALLRAAACYQVTVNADRLQQSQKYGFLLSFNEAEVPDKAEPHITETLKTSISPFEFQLSKVF